MYGESDTCRRAMIERRKGRVMDNQENGARWIHCPICGSNTQTKVYDDTVLIKFPLYCPQCKKEILVNVVQLKMVVCNESGT